MDVYIGMRFLKEFIPLHDRKYFITLKKSAFVYNFLMNRLHCQRQKITTLGVGRFRAYG